MSIGTNRCGIHPLGTIESINLDAHVKLRSDEIQSATCMDTKSTAKYNYHHFDSVLQHKT